MAYEATSKPLRVAFYGRVSSDEQVSGFGMDMQLESFKSNLNVKVTDGLWEHKKEWVFTDPGYSGGNLERPGYKDLMQAVKEKKVDLVVVWKIDRLSRSLSHLLKAFEDMKAHGVGFYSIKESIDFTGPVGRLTFQIFGALAEFEREMIRARTAEGKLSSARSGNYIGNSIPYGYKQGPKTAGKKGSQIIIVPEEAKVVKQIYHWFVFDGMSYTAITRQINELGLQKGLASKHKDKGTKWQDTTVKGILSNRTYVGLRTERIKDSDGNVQEIKVATPKIIDPILFEQAQRRVTEVSLTGGKRGGGYVDYLLSRLIVDTFTGRTFVGVKRSKDGRLSYRRKGFDHPETGERIKNLEFPGEAIEEFVMDHIKMAINDPKRFYVLYRSQSTTHSSIKRLREEIEVLKGIISQQDNTDENIELGYCEGRSSEEQRDNLLARSRAKGQYARKELIEKQSELDRQVEVSIAQEVVKNFSENFGRKMENLTFEQKQILVELLVKEIRVTAGEEIVVEVVFQFEQPVQKTSLEGCEPKNGSGKPQDCLLGMQSSIDGRGSRTRTCGLSVPNRAQ